MGDPANRILRVEIDDPGAVDCRPDMEREVRVAISDLVESNLFAPERGHFAGAPEGPFVLVLRIRGRRLVFDIAAADGAPVGALPLPLAPFRRIVRDYFAVCESYCEAVRTASPARIEALDMGRRSLHDEGSGRLRDLLAGRVAVDHDTARRLFTLICALHVRA